MKKFNFLFLAIISLFSLHAQTDSLLANYPLITDGIDATANNDDMTLKNAPFENGGVYSNGIYIGVDTTGSVIATPSINNFNFDQFTITVEFRIDSYPSSKNPVIIGGKSWRWIGAFIEDEHLAFMANDYSNYYVTDEVVELNTWNKLSISFSKKQKNAQLYLNGKLVYEELIPVLVHNDDGQFLNYHGGTGITFKGYWRNLKIFDTSGPAAIAENNPLNDIKVITNQRHVKIWLPSGEKEVNLQILDVVGKQLGSYRLTNRESIIHPQFSKTANYLLVFTNGKGQKAVKKVFINN